MSVSSDALPTVGRFARPSTTRVLGFAIGVVLLAAAVAAVFSRGDSVSAAVKSAAGAPWWMITLVLALPLVNVALTAASFAMLTNRHGRVGYGEMYCLVLSSWLLNHLPMRPGLVGRVAYHKAINGVSVMASVRVVVEQIVCGAAGLGLVLAAWMLTAERPAIWLIGAMAVSAAAMLCAGAAARAELLGAKREGPGATYLLATGLRIIDCGVWTLRYLLLFEMVGFPVSVHAAAAIALGSQVAMLSPVPVGLREWVVGLTAAAVAPVASGLTLDAVTPGVAADLVNRAGELLVALPLGLAASVWVWRRVSRAATGPGSHPRPAKSV